ILLSSESAPVSWRNGSQRGSCWGSPALWPACAVRPRSWPSSPPASRPQPFPPPVFFPVLRVPASPPVQALPAPELPVRASQAPNPLPAAQPSVPRPFAPPVPVPSVPVLLVPVFLVPPVPSPADPPSNRRPALSASVPHQTPDAGSHVRSL